MPPTKRVRKERNEDEVDESEVAEVDESEVAEVDGKASGFRPDKALLRHQIVLHVVKTLEPQEPQSLFMPLNTGKTGKYKLSNPFPRILNRMLQKTPSLQYAKVLPGSTAQSNPQDYLMMNVSECGKEGFDYDFEDSDGEELDRDALEDHIANMFVSVEEGGYATARQMQCKHNCTFHDVPWVTVHVTES